MTNQITAAFAHNARLGRGMNMGNMLEAARDGSWSDAPELKLEYFRMIREQGFHSVRIPTRWSDYAAAGAPYTIERDFFATVDAAVNAALEADLAVVLNVHHYEEIFERPTEHQARLLQIWSQLGEHYRDYASGLMFEVLNEPHGELTNEVWNDMLKAAVDVIRQSNPERALIVGPGGWNSIDGLSGFQPPVDNNTILTVHYYLPMTFTHQDTAWVNGSSAWLGTEWNGSEDEQQEIRRHFDAAQAFARERNMPVYLGEFGAYSSASMHSRARWTTYITRQAEARGWSWAYWEFCAGFGVYDPNEGTWRDPLLKALLG